MKLTFTVVIPVLNSPFIHRTLESLRRQEYDLSLVEVIVVGQDKYNLVREDSLVRFIPSPRPLFPGAARNVGIKRASSEIIAFLDADCFAAPDWLAVLARRYEDPEVWVVGGGVEFERGGNYWTFADNLSMFHEFMNSLPPSTREFLPSLNLSARRAVFDIIGLFDEKRPTSEDVDLTIRMRRAGFELHFEPRAVVYHCPARRSFTDLVRHGFYHGRYSTRIDPRYVDERGLPFPFRSRIGLVLGAPLLAAGATLRIFVPRRDLWRYWYAIPGVYISKLAWCLGASTGLKLWEAKP